MIESHNLILKPLSSKQLTKYLKNDGSLEKDLRLNRSQYIISNKVEEGFVENILPDVKDAGKNHLFTSLWVIILKTQSKIIGDIHFLSLPDVDGEIEIGYSTFKAFRGKGYMTEAIACILAWAKRQDFVKSIFAQTAKTNMPSWRILEKNGFEKVGDDESLFNWRLIF
ncbi:N-acetyltransferase [Pedobacter changchengzhani]|uniref:N-acetyltransferase n=1 Tax=Pedobacter changchengzhani TaxID=2529274 RepID=A0A4R5MI47_9SPHI|nr:GNAT family N-acetyltransferase [Pedobacter changchengzhani]TDG35222.1 N-acetyltransferase [Pedobacter changchengzhani]